jgi:hypothetical protein
MRARVPCPECGATLFAYDVSVVEPIVKQLQPALIFAPAEARQLLGGKSVPELMLMAARAVGARCAGCEYNAEPLR